MLLSVAGVWWFPRNVFRKLLSQTEKGGKADVLSLEEILAEGSELEAKTGGHVPQL